MDTTSLLQSLTTLLGKNFFLIPNPSLPWLHLPLALSFVSWEESLIPAWLSANKGCQACRGTCPDFPALSARCALTWGWSHGGGCQAVHVQSRHLLHLGRGKGCHGVQVSALRHRGHDRRLLLHQLEQREQGKNITRSRPGQPVAPAPGGRPVIWGAPQGFGVSAHHPSGTPQAWSFSLQGLEAKRVCSLGSLWS